MVTTEWLYFGALVLGALIGVAIRTVVDSAPSRERLYSLLSDWIVLYLLPFHVFTAFLRASVYKEVTHGLALMLWGIVLCAATFVVARVLCRAAALKSFAPATPFVASTFAGGGRAVLVAAVISPLIDRLGLFRHFGSNGTAIDALAIADVGYWLFYLLFVVAFLMPKAFAGQVETTASNFKPGAVLIGAVLGMAGVVITPELVGSEGLAVTRWVVSAAIVGLAALTFALRFELGAIRGAMRDVGFIVLSRSLGFAGALALAWFVTPSLFWQFLLVAFIFFVSPPSSLVDKLMFKAGATQAEADRAIQVGVAWNLGLLLMLLALAASSWYMLRAGLLPA